jgi:hypothetical protein
MIERRIHVPKRELLQQRTLHSASSAHAQAPRLQTPSHPVLQLQSTAGNQAVIQMMKDGVIQMGGGKNGQGGGSGGWFGNMLPSFPSFSNFGAKFGQETMRQTVREGVSAGFGSDSVDIYDMWKLRKDPKKLDEFMQDRMHRMDGGFQ